MNNPSKLNHTKNEKGFTLVELLIIIAVIGTLVAIAIPQFNQYKTAAYNSAAKASLHNIYLACKSYWTDNADSDACSIGIAEMTPYDYTQSLNVVVTITSGRKSTFKATAKHNSSNKTFTIDESGGVR